MHWRRGMLQAGGFSKIGVPSSTTERRRAVMTSASEKAYLVDYQDIRGPLPLEEIGTFELAGAAVVGEATGRVECTRGGACGKLEALATSAFHPLPSE
ncbi:hypothetical protein Q3G72_033268 [Acer saccharum]|nr:hypothetical protein Q3G72_033268 [Acer saccharum]